MMGEVIKFPGGKNVDDDAGVGETRGTAPRTCDRCIHFMAGRSGEYCRALDLDLLSIYEAATCDLYED